MDEAGELAKLEALREAGTISAGEYERQVKRVKAGKKAKPKTKRDQRLGCGCLSVVAVVAGLTILGGIETGWKGTPPSPEPPSKATSVPMASPLPAIRRPVTPAKPNPAATSFLATYQSYSFLTSMCDNAMRRMGDVASNLQNSSDMVEAYTKVRNAHEICGKAARNVRYFDIPADIPSELGLDDIRQSCGDIYEREETALAAYMEVIDGQGTPSKIVAIRDALDGVPSQSAVCAVKWASAAQKLGVKLPS